MSGTTVTSTAATGASSTARARARVALLGASGYSGLEFLRLARSHPGIEIKALVSREHVGKPAGALAAGLESVAAGLPDIVHPQALPSLHEEGAFDTVVACLPHGAFHALRESAPYLDRAERVIDLSSDHRDGRDGYVYGLPELDRSSLTGARRVANPGCYATAALLAATPALEAGWAAGPLCLTALSGASGAGRSPQSRTSFVELAESAAAYRVGTEHAHVAEIARAAGTAAGHAIEVAFTPQIVPMSRGILLTAYLAISTEISPEDARARYVARYAGEPFVRVLPANTWPETGAVRGSNRADVAVTTLFGGRTLLVVAALDNLVKGASGQALQNLNLMLGWPEETSLPVHGSAW